MPDDTLDGAARDYFHPERWPLLPRPASNEDFGRCVLEVLRTEAGRLLLNHLVLTYLLGSDDPALSAQRQLGRQDVIRHMLEWLGAGLQRAHLDAVETYRNPWE